VGVRPKEKKNSTLTGTSWRGTTTTRGPSDVGKGENDSRGEKKSLWHKGEKYKKALGTLKGGDPLLLERDSDWVRNRNRPKTVRPKAQPMDYM